MPNPNKPLINMYVSILREYGIDSEQARMFKEEYKVNTDLQTVVAVIDIQWRSKSTPTKGCCR